LATSHQYPTEEVRIGVLTAMRRHWFVALLPVVLFVGAAVGLGLKRTPQYTAVANLSIGAVFTDNPAGISSVIQGTESLAAVYSRVIGANDVVEDTKRRLDGRYATAPQQVSATPIPDSPMIKVTAAAGSEGEAVALANAASAALADYANRQDRTDDEATALSKRYRRAALRYRQRLSVVRKLQEKVDNDPSEENRRVRDRAAAAADTALLHRDALLTSYQNAVEGTRSGPPLEVFREATAASSDRYERLQLLVFTGLVGGLLAGAALALLRALPKSRRGS
jgi:capsular polysaccharide biosynthesis protein